MEIFLIDTDTYYVIVYKWWYQIFGIKPKHEIYFHDKSKSYILDPTVGVYYNADTNYRLSMKNRKTKALDKFRCRKH